MKQVLLKQGRPSVEEVPAPQIEPGTVLVQVAYSCISTGTEMSALNTGSVPLWKRALRQPDKALQVFQIAAKQGLAATRTLVQSKLSAGQPTGYSAAGVAIAVGEGVEGFQLGDRVACAGAQCAYHAEMVRVPYNLVVAIPDEVDTAAASSVALGAIALQGVRRLQPTLGECFVVLGLGIVGQLVVQILRANGCRVIGTDLDRARLEQAQAAGMEMGLYPDGQDDVSQAGQAAQVAQVARLTGGLGADGVIITAQSPSDQIVATAFQMCRKKGRVVVIGDVGLLLNRADLYQKELDFFISTSYGPGRYDTNYEEHGIDYPVAYVRWTENGNMSEYLRLLAEEKVQVSGLIAATYPIGDAAEAYAALQQSTPRPLVVLLSYPAPQDRQDGQAGVRPSSVVPNPISLSSRTDRIRIAIVGAGSFAMGTHVPHLQALSDHFQIQAVMSRSGHTAAQASRQCGAAYATTEYQHVLDDSEIDAVLIATRHNRHADLTLAALRAGKHVFVEKPLALRAEDLDAVREFYTSTDPSGEPLASAPLLMTGFNRRFSPYADRLRTLTRTRTNPMILNYQMNAGYLPRDHWTQAAEGGGRNKGEACHIYDLFTYLINQPVTSVHAQALTPTTEYYSRTDNFVATLAFQDGSVASLTYTALGTPEYPKEQLDIYCDGKVFALHDYQQLLVYGVQERGLQHRRVEKGHREELLAFAQAIRHGGEWPIPLWQQLQATHISFVVEHSLHAASQESRSDLLSRPRLG